VASEPTSPGDPGTRYARVKQILDEAARGSTADYGGNGRFWRASLEDFKTVCVHGVRMIAPESATTSCGCSDGQGQSRSARSGLVQGLRGAPPFDGVRFPLLMWGGDRVGDDDVAFIADWIDDGCPAEDDEVTVLDAAGESTVQPHVELADVKEFGAVEWPDWIASRPGTPRQRGNLDCLSDTQLDRMRQAFRCIYDLDHHVEDRRNYNNQALIHQNHCQHGWERFLPWHRAYLYEFEQNLQDFFPRFTLPYWDWTAEKYQPKGADLGALIPESFQAFLTEAEAGKLVDVLDPRPTAAQKQAFLELARVRKYFTSQRQFFCYVIKTIGYTQVTPNPKDANRRRMIDALLASNALWYPLRYPAEYGGKTINTRFHRHFPSGEDMAEILSLNNFRDFGGGSIYDAAFGFLDQNPHNTMHLWTGGLNPDAGTTAYPCDEPPPRAEKSAAAPPNAAARRNAMARVAGRSFHSREDLYSQPDVGDMLSNLTASYDQVFWPIHVNIDRTWWEWQKLNPNALPADLDSVLSPWNYTIRDTLDVARFGYEYVRGSFFMPVGLEAPIARFVSQPIPIQPNLKAFRRAEIRLHWVPQLQRSCFVRAFLNDPAANDETPLHDNPHFAGYLAIFGHGPCYGGPGHCDPPPPQPRDYDWRTRSHNTPRNHRIDVTKSAKKLLETSDALQVTLLVIGPDYEEDPDLLKLEGVSLSLFD
jgi:tyrosinase